MARAIRAKKLFRCAGGLQVGFYHRLSRKSICPNQGESDSGVRWMQLESSNLMVERQRIRVFLAYDDCRVVGLGKQPNHALHLQLLGSTCARLVRLKRRREASTRRETHAGWRLGAESLPETCVDARRAVLQCAPSPCYPFFGCVNPLESRLCRDSSRYELSRGVCMTPPNTIHIDGAIGNCGITGESPRIFSGCFDAYLG